MFVPLAVDVANPGDMEIRQLAATDWEEVKTIYEKGIATGNATFQTSAPAWEAWDRAHLSNCRIVGLADGKVIGWAALTPVSSRCVYAGVAEVSVYIDPDLSGKGFGLEILNRLVQLSEAAGIWTLQAGIFPENAASVRIHKKAGFRIIGNREKIGKQQGVWRDTLLLERRSQLIY